MLRNQKTNRLTEQGNSDLHKNQQQISAIYNQWRDAGYSMEEVFYMITTAAHECILDESISGRRREYDNVNVNSF